jgi:hypothetical protein
MEARPEKAYTIELDEREDYLYVLVGGGRLTATISATYWNEIAERCFDLEQRKILIEKNFKESVTPEEMLRMADHLGSLLPNRRIAFVDRFGHDNINELGKRLARNRNVMMQIFESTADAERWLQAN